MKRMLMIGLAAGVLAFVTGCDNKKGAFIESVPSQNNVPTAVNKFLTLIKEKNLVHFTTINHAANAKKVNMDLKPETVVLFGNPRAGTKLMECNPSMGMDLPLKMLFTTNYEGETTISYTNPEYWTLKHNIKDKQCLAIIQKIHMVMKELAKEAAKK
jgi:uncharacterized protein (DUF302 family)